MHSFIILFIYKPKISYVVFHYKSKITKSFVKFYIFPISEITITWSLKGKCYDPYLVIDTIILFPRMLIQYSLILHY